MEMGVVATTLVLTHSADCWNVIQMMRRIFPKWFWFWDCSHQVSDYCCPRSHSFSIWFGIVLGFGPVELETSLKDSAWRKLINCEGTLEESLTFRELRWVLLALRLRVILRHESVKLWPYTRALSGSSGIWALIKIKFGPYKNLLWVCVGATRTNPQTRLGSRAETQKGIRIPSHEFETGVSHSTPSSSLYDESDDDGAKPLQSSSNSPVEFTCNKTWPTFHNTETF